MKVLIYKASVDPNISHDEFVLINDVITEYEKWKKKSKIQRLNQFYRRF